MEISATVSPYIGVIPPSTVNQTLVPGMNYTVSIYTDYNGSDVWGYEFELTFDPNVLQGVEVVNGDLITGSSAVFAQGTFNNTAGNLSLTGCFFFFMTPPPPLTSGPGILANVTFRVIGLGTSDITLETTGPERTKLLGFADPWIDPHLIIDPETMPDQIQHGFFSNVPDVAVTSVTPSVIEAKPGTIVGIDVSVLNNGSETESFNVTAYYNSNEIDTTEVSLEAGQNTTLSLAWNTTGVTEGDYTISAYAWPLPKETDIADNTYIDGEVRITSLIHDVAVTNVTPSSTVVLAGDEVDITVTVRNKGTETEAFDVTVYYDNRAIGTQTVTDLAQDAEETLTFLWDTTSITVGNYTIKAIASPVNGEANVADNTYVDGEIEIITHDVAVTSITISPPNATVGENVTITVVVKNNGTEMETFNVKVYRDTTEIGNKDVTDLPPDDEETLTFTWDTTTVAAGDYTLKAVASTVAGEIVTANNTKIYGTFTLFSPSSVWPPVEIVVALVAAITIVAIGSYAILKRRRKTSKNT